MQYHVKTYQEAQHSLAGFLSQRVTLAALAVLGLCSYAQVSHAELSANTLTQQITLGNAHTPDAMGSFTHVADGYGAPRGVTNSGRGFQLAAPGTSGGGGNWGGNNWSGNNWRGNGGWGGGYYGAGYYGGGFYGVSPGFYGPGYYGPGPAFYYGAGPGYYGYRYYNQWNNPFYYNNPVPVRTIILGTPTYRVVPATCSARVNGKLYRGNFYRGRCHIYVNQPMPVQMKKHHSSKRSLNSL